jgi:hypothetical protein
MYELSKHNMRFAQFSRLLEFGRLGLKFDIHNVIQAILPSKCGLDKLHNDAA